MTSLQIDFAVLHNAAAPDDVNKLVFAERDVMEYRPTADRSHSTLMLRARMTLPHFFVSSAISLPKSAGEPANAGLPRSASCALIFGSASAVLISLLRLSMTSVRRAFG
jgi:hypothetical protein